MAVPVRSLYNPKFLEQELAMTISGTVLAIKRSPAASSSIPSPRPW